MAETLEPKQFLTFEDVVISGACANGVINACDAAGMFAGKVDECLAAFPAESARILRAANLDGYGYGYGYGDGYGDGDV